MGIHGDGAPAEFLRCNYNWRERRGEGGKEEAGGGHWSIEHSSGRAEEAPRHGPVQQSAPISLFPR